jgi:hypothetical protein
MNSTNPRRTGMRSATISLIFSHERGRSGQWYVGQRGVGGTGHISEARKNEVIDGERP